MADLLLPIAIVIVMRHPEGHGIAAANPAPAGITAIGVFWFLGPSWLHTRASPYSGQEQFWIDCGN